MLRLVLLLMVVLLAAPIFLVTWLGNALPVENENKDILIEQQKLEIVKLKYDLKQMAKYAASRQTLCTVKAKD